MGSGPLPLLFRLDAHHRESYRQPVGGHSFAVNTNFGGVQNLLCSESQRELGVRGPGFEMRQALHRPWVGGEATLRLTRRQSAGWRRESSLSGCGTRRHGGANGHARWHRSESSDVRVAIAAAASELSLCRQALRAVRVV
eukprot:3136509-Rhodomonas_salina.1